MTEEELFAERQQLVKDWNAFRRDMEALVDKERRVMKTLFTWLLLTAGACGVTALAAGYHLWLMLTGRCGC